MLRIELPAIIDNVNCGEPFTLDFKVQVFSKETNINCVFYFPSDEIDCSFLVLDEGTNTEIKRANISKSWQSLHFDDGPVPLSLTIKLSCDFEGDTRPIKIKCTATDDSGYHVSDIVIALTTC